MAKLLSDRREMAMAMNFGKYPVLSIDLADADEYGLKGCQVRIDAGTFDDGLPYYIDAELRVYRDERQLTTFAGGVFLSNDFTYRDYENMVKKAQAPLIGKNMEVVVAIYDSRTQTALKPILIKTGSVVHRHCSTPLRFEAYDMTQYLGIAGVKMKGE